MPTLTFELTIPAPVERVWAWHEDVLKTLPLLTPPEHETSIESASPLPPVEGTEVVIHAKVPIRGKVRFVARYTAHVPPHPVAFGIEARFVDQQLAGPFAFWQHEHEFEALNSKTTRMVDRITYRPPLWPLTLPADLLIIRPSLKKMFAYRHRITLAAFA